VLRAHARHVDTGEPVPEALLAKLKAAKDYGAGFAAAEYTACALLDQELHALPAAALEAFDVGAFEAAALERIGMPQGMALRHRPAHFSHLFSGDLYASAYYCYIWAEVLDADAFEAFTEAPGGVFDGEVARRVLEFVYSQGNTMEPCVARPARPPVALAPRAPFTMYTHTHNAPTPPPRLQGGGLPPLPRARPRDWRDA
jgi:peptidyl-dipeptidase Dcp